VETISSFIYFIDLSHPKYVDNISVSAIRYSGKYNSLQNFVHDRFLCLKNVLILLAISKCGVGKKHICKLDIHTKFWPGNLKTSLKNIGTQGRTILKGVP
jgi:hypothetical protein